MVFEFFFSDGSEPNTNSPISYFGESFPMTFLLQNLNKCQNRLHDPGERTNLSNPPKHLTQSKIAFLHSEKSFTKPQAQVLDQLVATYFQVVHPVLPIIDRAQFMTLYHSEKVPWLLLHAVCFAASTHCSLDILCRDGVFCTRRDARTSFYNRAKALFDIDYERNRLVLLQAALLLSFWGGESSDYWNTFSWVNTAINIAESLGMHRSVPTFEMPPLWKRIWWCLVTRDSFCSALLGRPLRINIKQCDLEMISKRDFETDIDPVGPGADLFGTRMIEHAYFVIEMTKLALILRTIIQARPNIRTDPEFVFGTNKQLEEWHSNLPPCLRLDFCTPDTTVQVLASALALLYNHNLIYLHQPASEASPLSASITENAVTAISDLGSSLVTESALQFLPQDAYAAFFLAVIMLFAEIQNAQSIAEVRFLEAHVKICEMVVHQAREHWDHADWILSLSSNLRDKLVSTAEASRQGITSSSTIERMYTTPPQYPPQQPPDQQDAQMYDADIAEFVKSWETTTLSDTLFSEMSSLFGDI
ncbi:fungal-specific transcription factor domain-containing protein [Lipomyces starkeyi]